jgi:hypothetical protein
VSFPIIVGSLFYPRERLRSTAESDLVFAPGQFAWYQPRMLATAGSWRWIVPAALALVACGGSSSETPPPLPPHPLNKPYREPSAVQTKADAEAEENALASAARDADLLDAATAPSKGKSTWGSNEPAPLPELAPK